VRKKSQTIKIILKCLASYVTESDGQIAFAGCAGCDEQALCHKLKKTITSELKRRQK